MIRYDYECVRLRMASMKNDVDLVHIAYRRVFFPQYWKDRAFTSRWQISLTHRHCKRDELSVLLGFYFNQSDRDQKTIRLKCIVRITNAVSEDHFPLTSYPLTLASVFNRNRMLNIFRRAKRKTVSLAFHPTMPFLASRSIRRRKVQRGRFQKMKTDFVTCLGPNWKYLPKRKFSRWTDTNIISRNPKGSATCCRQVWTKWRICTRQRTKSMPIWKSFAIDSLCKYNVWLATMRLSWVLQIMRPPRMIGNNFIAKHPFHLLWIWMDFSFITPAPSVGDCSVPAMIDLTAELAENNNTDDRYLKSSAFCFHHS